MPADSASAELRVACLLRSGGLCEHCGQPLDTGWEMHHRLAGGMGGTRRDRDLIENVLALISTHHNLAPDSVHMRGVVAREHGWVISKYDERPPADVPVLVFGRRWVLLTPAGTYEPVSEALGAVGGGTG